MIPGVVLLLGATLSLAGCTSLNVRPLTQEEPIRSVLIEENPKVWRSDFLQVLAEGFRRNGIEVQVIQSGTAVGDAFVVRYTARQKWDTAMYPSDATIWMYGNDREIAKAVYHLRGGGGLSLMKWQGTVAKIDPVIDELLATASAGSPDRDTSHKGRTPVPVARDPSTSAALAATRADVVCDLPSLVDAAECRGDRAMGMATNEILKRLGRPDEMRADGTMLRYGDRYLRLDEKSSLIGIPESGSEPPNGQHLHANRAP